jgi:quercetin dioxygenase-like cupin family protein
MRNPILFLAAVMLGLFVAGGAVAQEIARETDAPAPIAQEDLEWVEIIPGVAFAAAYGRWTEGAHGKFVRFDPGVSAPMHRHNSAYRGVVVQGELTNPYPGEEVVVMRPGDFWRVPADMAHSNECVSDEPCVFFTYGEAAWDIEVVGD